MGAQIRVGCIAVALLLSWSAHADSLRCAGGTVQEGDSRASLLQKCGQPQTRDSFCAPVFRNKALVPEPLASNAASCEQIDDWIYEGGKDKPTANVRIRSATVQSIRVQRLAR